MAYTLNYLITGTILSGTIREADYNFSRMIFLLHFYIECCSQRCHNNKEYDPLAASKKKEKFFFLVRPASTNPDQSH
jgi:hypothetical protein